MNYTFVLTFCIVVELAGACRALLGFLLKVIPSRYQISHTLEEVIVQLKTAHKVCTIHLHVHG